MKTSQKYIKCEHTDREKKEDPKVNSLRSVQPEKKEKAGTCNDCGNFEINIILPRY